MQNNANALFCLDSLAIQEQIDEIGRMLGGWLKTLK